MNNESQENRRSDKLLLVASLLLMLFLCIVSFKPNFTGFTLTGFNIMDKTGSMYTVQSHDITLNKTYVFNTTDSLHIIDNVTGNITSIKITGTYHGEFKLWINNSGQLLLVAESQNHNNLLTGMEISDIGSADSNSNLSIVTDSSVDSRSIANINTNTDINTDTNTNAGINANKNAGVNNDTSVDTNVVIDENSYSNSSTGIHSDSSDELNYSEPLLADVEITNATSIISDISNITPDVNLSDNGAKLIDESNVTEQNVTTQNFTEDIVNTSDTDENINLQNVTKENASEVPVIENITNATIIITEPVIVDNITNMTAPNSTINASLNYSNTLVYDPIVNECVDTCDLSINLTTASLIIELSENSTLTIESISYTSSEPIINAPPVQIRDIEDIYLNNSEIITLNISDYFTDADNDSLIADSESVKGINYTVQQDLITYNVSNLSSNYSMFVYATDGKSLVESNVFHIFLANNNETMNLSNITSNVSVETIQYPAHVGQKVKWVKKVSSTQNITDVSIEIPQAASNITVTNSKHERKALTLPIHQNNSSNKNISKSKDKQKGKLGNADVQGTTSSGGNDVSNNDVSNSSLDNALTNITLNESSTTVDVEYYTDAPNLTEVNLTKSSKEVQVYSDMHYTNVTADSTLPIPINSAQDIVLKWKVMNDSFNDSIDASYLNPEELSSLYRDGFVYINIPFTLIDSNNDSLYDTIEWVAPHLSNQTFEIIVITKADLLDENRSVIESIYDAVKEKDGVWFNVTENDYVRVTFERPLDSSNDITIYAKAESNNAAIVVYEKDKDEPIAEFTNLMVEKYYKIYLTNLKNTQDTFDLKIINGTVGLDQIIDPATNISACGSIISSGQYTLNQSITSTGTCINVTVDNVSIDCQGYTITYDTGGAAGYVGINASNGANARTNLTVKNCKLIKGSNLQSSGYGISLSKFNNSCLINNTIYTNGTTNNYGIFLTVGSSNNLIENNTIFTNGSSTGNFGIYLLTGCSNNTINYNTINASGVGTGYGIAISGLTTASQNNTISNNIITTAGAGASNYGIYITTNANSNNISNNVIVTNGTTTNHGIYLLGAAATPVNNNIIYNNSVKAFGTAGAITNYGIVISTNANLNTIIKNNISTTNGTVNDWGVYITGTAALTANSNIVDSNIIRTNGTTTDNYGVYLFTNANSNNVTNNQILTSGTSNNHGIYISGNTFACNNNTISSNNVTAFGTAGTNYGIYLYRNVNSTIVKSNNVSTIGTITNYGIYLIGTAAMTVNSNLIDSNIVQTAGTTTNNYGVYLVTNANNNNVTNNNISTLGSTGNTGIYVSGTTAASTGNLFYNNIIRTNGTLTGNYGLELTLNANTNNVSSNTIITNGTNNNYGIYLLGAAGTPVNNNTIYNNSIKALGTAGVVSNIGVTISTNANNNDVMNNNVTVYGTTNNWGVYITGTAVLTANSNMVDSNYIYTVSSANTGNYGVYLLTNTNLNNITNNIISTSGTATNYGVYIAGSTYICTGNLIADNNITANGSGASNYGIYLYRNVSSNIVFSNSIYTSGTTTNHGIYISGTTATLAADYNDIDSNTINATGTAGAVTNYGVAISSNTDYNNVTNNNITTYGTVNNWGVYINGAAGLTANYNLVDSNNIHTFGTAATNYGVYLLTNTNNNTITNNNISTLGSTGNIGVLVSGTAVAAAGNYIYNNNIRTNGTLTGNYGLELTLNANTNNVSGNTIVANGSNNNHGIYLLGAAATPVNNNTIYNNSINAYGTAGAVTNYGITISTNANNNDVMNNNVTVYGTTNNWGVYITGTAGLTANYNLVDSNNIQTFGTAATNYGVYLLTNTNNNNVTNNNISTLGSTGNIGVLVSGTAVASTGNLVYNNNIATVGTTTANHGIELTLNANSNNVSGNDIITNGTTTSYGIYLLGAAATPVNYNEISYNTIQTQCSVASSNCHGIYLQNLVANNSIILNNITTGGTTNNFGIYLLGMAALPVNWNTIDSNTLNVSRADRINIGAYSPNNTISRNLIINRDYTYDDFNISAPGVNGTSFIDQYLEPYSFNNTGGTISVENTAFGKVVFLETINGSGSNFSNDINISQNYIYVNSSQNGLNQSAILSLYNLSFVAPVILRNGVLCIDCVILNYTGGNLTFNVTGFSSYSATDDTTYPQFSSLTDNNATLIGFGIGLFNVTVNNTNGTVWLEINNTNITAINFTSGMYSANYTFTSNGTYSYRWWANGNGTGRKINSSYSINYFVNPSYIPNITAVQSIAPQDPIEFSLKNISFTFTVDDLNGNSTINISSAVVTVNNSGITRQSPAGSCIGVPINTTAQNISCNISMQYYDAPGVWSINVSISDINNDYVQNTTTAFTYNTLYAIALNTNLLDIGSLNAGTVNKSAGMLVLNNTGNFNYTLVQIKSYDLVNGSDIIAASNFRINITNVSSGFTLSNNTFVNITGAYLPRGNDSGVGNESMYLYVDVPLGIPAKKYNSALEWILSLS